METLEKPDTPDGCDTADESMRPPACRGAVRAAQVHPRWSRIAYRRVVPVVLVALIGSSVLLALGARDTSAQPAGAPADASCAALARVDPTATNGVGWGRTTLPGNHAPGGWFGVDVCANASNIVAPNGSSVSCDRVPADIARTGCAPGHPTSDGYGWTFQCPELVVRFSAWAFGDSPAQWGRTGWGNAPDLWAPANHPGDFVMYPNGSAHAPVPGDILIWGSLDANGQPWPSGPNGEHGGHIAVVAAVRGGMVITAEQNVKWGGVDHPSDTLALTQVGGRWILSGSQAHETTLPTYRWRHTMGLSRGTYGWLHSTRNTGVFPSHSSGSALAAMSAGQQISGQAPGGLPSLAPAVAITSGTLTDVVWSTGEVFDAAQATGAPQARSSALGAPPGAALTASQTPAVVVLPDGTRCVYVVGTDGHLYQAVTSAQTPGVSWSDLAAPYGETLVSSPRAAAVAGGVMVVVKAADGSLWWRAVEDGGFGPWMPLDTPLNLTLGSFAIAGAPGSGAPLVLALGGDGRVYARSWHDATSVRQGDPATPAGWSPWLLLNGIPSGVRFTGQLLVASEGVTNGDQSEGVGAAALDVIVLDDAGAVRILRSTSPDAGWTLQTLEPAPRRLDHLLGAVAVSSSVTGARGAQAAALHVYAASASAVYETVVPASSALAGTPAAGMWTTFPALPPGDKTMIASLAVPLGQDASAVLITTTGGLLLGATSDIADLLLPLTPTPHAPAGLPAPARWMPLGAVAVFAAFSDTLRALSLDPRWQLAGTGASAAADLDGALLTPGVGGVAALMQLAAQDATSLTVRVTFPQGASDTTQAGLVLYLDSGDWATLTVNGAGAGTLCRMAAPAGVACQTAKIGRDSVRRGVTLRFEFTPAVVLGQVLPNGGAETLVGGWTVAPPAGSRATTTPTPVSTVTATLLAGPFLAYTEWGIVVSGPVTGAATAPRLSDFLVGGKSTTGTVGSEP
jgi:hypothetical protein